MTISWTLPDPPVKPAAYHRWEKVPPPKDASAAELERRLDWPLQTLATLGDAFERRLVRATGWDDATGTKPSPIELGARIFKRGVGYRVSGAPFQLKTISGKYEIVVKAEEISGATLASENGLVIVDGNVARLWPETFKGLNAVVLTLDENSKTLESVAKILEAARQSKASGLWTIVGGGLLSDVAAFAASLAGARMRFVPTTLLAMADACVGGKTGVNFAPYGKNQLGTFHFPEQVLVSTSWLKTLPERELHAGVAECLKHAFLSGDLVLAQRLATASKARDLKVFHDAMIDVISVKAKVVAEDPSEIGRRAILNFGHTLAHALEGFSQRRTTGDDLLLHGEAVGLGMVFALALSRRVARLSQEAESSMLTHMQTAGLLPTRAALALHLGLASESDLTSTAVFDELKALMGHDKKNVTFGGSTVHFVLLDAPGKVARESQREWTISVFDTELGPAWTQFLRTLL